MRIPIGLQHLGAGICAGAIALMLDALLLRAAKRFWVEVAPGLLAAYLSVGLLVGLVAWAVQFAWRDRQQDESPLWTLGVGVPIIYAVGLWERMAILVGAKGFESALVAIVVAVGTAVAVVVFAKIGAAHDRAWLGSFSLGVCMATFLIGNRTFVDRPLTPRALLFDACCGLLALTVLLLWRGRLRSEAWDRRVGLQTAILVAAVSAPAVLFAWLLRINIDRQIPVGPAASSDKPHVVMLVLDTTRGDVFDDVLRNTTEGQDLAEALGDMVWFDQATAAGASTPPSMTSIMTGLYPAQHGINGSGMNWVLSIHKDVVLLAERLSDEGYATLSFVANQAIDRFKGLHRGVENYTNFYTATELYSLGKPAARLLNRPWSPHVFAAEARRQMEAGLRRFHREDRPTFLWLQLMDSHYPIVDHPELPPTAVDSQLTAGQLRYRNTVRFAAKHLALTVGDIRRRFPAENSITVLLADHGEMLVEDGNASPKSGSVIGHGHGFFESIVRVPLGIQLPRGANPVGRSQMLASHVDIVPTIYEVLGLQSDSPLPGCSLVPWARDPGRAETCRHFAVSHGLSRQPGHRALRTAQLKVMTSADNEFSTRLYELGADPGELSDRADERQDAVAASVALLEQFWAQFEGAAPGDEPTDLDAEAVEKLRALGYLQ